MVYLSLHGFRVGIFMVICCRESYKRPMDPMHITPYDAVNFSRNLPQPAHSWDFMPGKTILNSTELRLNPLLPVKVTSSTSPTHQKLDLTNLVFLVIPVREPKGESSFDHWCEPWQSLRAVRSHTPPAGPGWLLMKSNLRLRHPRFCKTYILAVVDWVPL